jgi:hypothetical protein
MKAQCQCIAPSASVVPSHIFFAPGDSIVLNASVTGTTPIDFQWYKLSKGKIMGATSPKYTLHNIMTADTVYLRVTNDCGNKFSNPVYLELDKNAVPKSKKKGK